MTGKGRRKTGMGLVENKAARLVCFSKRRAGLFKKIRELSVLTGAQVGALVFSPAGKSKTFNSPTLEFLIEAQAQIFSEESRLEDDWEARFHQSWDGDTASDWWERADVQSMGLEEVRRFKSALESSAKKWTDAWPINEILPPSSSVEENLCDDSEPMSAILPPPSPADANLWEDSWLMNAIIPPPSPADGNFWDDSCFMNSGLQKSSLDQLPIEDNPPSFSSDAIFFSGGPPVEDMDRSFMPLPWNNFPELQQLELHQQQDALFLRQSSHDLLPIPDYLSLSSSDASFFPGGLSIDAMDSSFISSPSYESLEQQQWSFDWLINATLADDEFQRHQLSLEQPVVSHDLAPIADLSPWLSLGFF